MNWTETNSYLKGIDNRLDQLSDPVRVAGFDLDDTIIHKPFGKKNEGKWKIIDLNIGQKIADLVKNKYIIVIFTNQSGMSGKNFDKPQWRKAINDLAKIMFGEVSNQKYYFAVYVAKGHDLYRKPNLGLWELMKSDLKSEFKLDTLRISKKSFFCGDAAGRIYASPFKKKLHPSSNKGDFSDSDRKFALNIGIDFLTPEEFYLDNAPDIPYKLEGVDPSALAEQVTKQKITFKPRSNEMIVMVGMPGSGKTEFVTKHILPHGYIHINQDTCKTKAKCLALAKQALEKNKSVVIDNTNPNVLSRMTYTTMAKDFGYKHIRAIVMKTDENVANHLNNVRHVYSKGVIPKIVPITYNVFKKNYVPPQPSENFDQIETVDFIFDKKKLEDPDWKRIFMKWSS